MPTGLVRTTRPAGVEAVTGTSLRGRDLQALQGQHRLPRRSEWRLLQRALGARAAKRRCPSERPYRRDPAWPPPGRQPLAAATARRLQHPERTHAGLAQGPSRLDTPAPARLGRADRPARAADRRTPTDPQTPSRNGLPLLPGPALASPPVQQRTP